MKKTESYKNISCKDVSCKDVARNVSEESRKGVSHTLDISRISHTPYQNNIISFIQNKINSFIF